MNLFKYFALIFIGGEILIAGFLFSHYRTDLGWHMNSIKADEFRHVEIQKKTLTNDLRDVLTDLQILASNPLVKEVLIKNQLSDKEELARVMIPMIEQKGTFVRISLISAQKEVLVRVIRGKDKPQILIDKSIIDEAGREFFEKVMTLSTGEIFLATFKYMSDDVTGVVRVRNTIRFGKAIFEEDRVIGMLSIVYRTGDLLEDIANTSSNVLGKALLIDSTGALLEEFATEEDTQFLRKRDEETRFNCAFPGLWARMNGLGRGQFFIENEGMITFERISPFMRGLKILDEKALAFERNGESKGEEDWIIASYIPPREIDKIRRLKAMRYSSIFLFFTLILAIGAYYISNAIIKREEAERVLRERMDKIELELDMARNVLDSILPKELSKFDGIKISSTYLPSGKIGGDFYDVMKREKGEIVFFVFDVVGHGVPAALYTSLARFAFVKNINAGYSPSEIIEKTNDELVSQMGEDHFLTAFLGVYDTERRWLRYSTAACPPALLVRPEGGGISKLVLPGIPMGLFKGQKYGEGFVELCTGDKIIVYTDGLVESRNISRELYHALRLERLVLQKKDLDADALKDAIIEDNERFRGSAERHDDITLLILEIV